MNDQTSVEVTDRKSEDSSYQRFLQNVSGHELAILRDDGVYRHLRLRDKEMGFRMSFEIVTWPGYLAYAGDMGSYTWARLHDMFEWFRGDVARDPAMLDFGYRSEKLVATEKYGGHEEFYSERFEELIEEYLVEFIDNYGLNEDEAEILREDVDGAIVDCISNGRVEIGEAVRLASEYDWKGRPVFQDIWDHRLTRWTPRFVWACYAVPWAIARYDKARA